MAPKNLRRKLFCKGLAVEEALQNSFKVVFPKTTGLASVVFDFQ
jgi:hypothetical protein